MCGLFALVLDVVYKYQKDFIFFKRENVDQLTVIGLMATNCLLSLIVVIMGLALMSEIKQSRVDNNGNVSIRTESEFSN
jgi:hypothetical protein